MPKSQAKSKSCLGCLGCLGIAAIAIVLLGIVGAFQASVQTQYFSEHRTEILKAVRADLEAKRYDEVIQTAAKYSAAGDPELRQLRDEAERFKKQQRVDILRAAIAETTDSRVKEQKVKELLVLVPDDSSARAMLAEIKADLVSSQADTSATSESNYIPGLAAVDVHGNLTNKGFTLTKDFSDPQQPIWRCVEETAKHKTMVEVFGESPTRITLVRATYSNYSQDDTDQSGSQFMAYAASIPYDGSDPRRAQTWVKANMGNGTTTTIGGVSFELIPSAPRVRILLIQPGAQ